MNGTMKGICRGKGNEARKERLGGRQVPQLFKDRFLRNAGGFGMNELLGLAAALIIAGLLIPRLSKLAGNIMVELEDWWSATIKSKIFSTSVVTVIKQIFLLG